MSDKNQSRKMKAWRKVIGQLSEQTGVSFRDVCEYTGFSYNDNGVSFYVKLPRKRSSYIGIGMAFGQPLEVINGWINEFGDKRRLYAKDISEDLVWIYLINANYNDRSGKINYFQKYDEFQSVAYAVFCERWDEIIMRFEDTSDVEISLAQADYGEEYDGIKTFVAEHMDAFKTAYSKPRKLLDNYVNSILGVYKRHPEVKGLRSLNAMRGFLDDSMINFLSGNSDTFNVIDRKTGRRTINIKHVPKGRMKYICMCMALGMTEKDLGTFLDLMGYLPLQPDDKDEEILIAELSLWEQMHKEQRLFKWKYIDGDGSVNLKDEEELKAVTDMLRLRTDLAERYSGREKVFPYV